MTGERRQPVAKSRWAAKDIIAGLMTVPLPGSRSPELMRKSSSKRITGVITVNCKVGSRLWNMEILVNPICKEQTLDEAELGDPRMSRRCGRVSSKRLYHLFVTTKLWSYVPSGTPTVSVYWSGCDIIKRFRAYLWWVAIVRILVGSYTILDDIILTTLNCKGFCFLTYVLGVENQLLRTWCIVSRVNANSILESELEMLFVCWVKACGCRCWFQLSSCDGWNVRFEFQQMLVHGIYIEVIVL